MVGNKGGLAARANYPWILIGLLWLVAFLNAADRNILLAVLPDHPPLLPAALAGGLLGASLRVVQVAAVVLVLLLGRQVEAHEVLPGSADPARDRGERRGRGVR